MKSTKRRDVLKILKDEGYEYEREGRHPIFKSERLNSRIPVPNGNEISPGTFRDILKAVERAKELKKNADKLEKKGE